MMHVLSLTQIKSW